MPFSRSEVEAELKVTVYRCPLNLQLIHMLATERPKSALKGNRVA